MDLSESDALGTSMATADDVFSVRPDLDHAIAFHPDGESAEGFTEATEGGVILSHGSAARCAG
jgi:hypothetical protein